MIDFELAIRRLQQVDSETAGERLREKYEENILTLKDRDADIEKIRAAQGTVEAIEYLIQLPGEIKDLERIDEEE